MHKGINILINNQQNTQPNIYGYINEVLMKYVF